MHAIPLAFAAGVGHCFMGNVDWALLGWMLVGSVPGVLLGAHLTTRAPEAALRPMLAVLLLLSGAKILTA